MAELGAFLSILKEGGWGVASLAIVGMLWAVKKWDACNERGEVRAGKSEALLEKATAAMTLMAGALDSRMGRFEKLEDKVDCSMQAAEVSRQILGGKLDAASKAIDDLTRSVNEFGRRA